MLKVQSLQFHTEGIKILQGISFQAEENSITGIIGANGSGKSTCIKIIAGLLKPTEGTVTLNSDSPGSLSWKKNTGYSPEEAACYPDMTVSEYLHFVAVLREQSKSQVAEIIELCNLQAVIKKCGRELSKGYRQRLNLAQALIHKPKLLLLDEPATGLDPEQLGFFHALLSEISATTTVLLSTHQLNEAYKLCSKIFVFAEGRIMAVKNPANLSAEAAFFSEKVL